MNNSTFTLPRTFADNNTSISPVNQKDSSFLSNFRQFFVPFFGTNKCVRQFFVCTKCEAPHK